MNQLPNFLFPAITSISLLVVYGKEGINQNSIEIMSIIVVTGFSVWLQKTGHLKCFNMNFLDNLGFSLGKALKYILSEKKSGNLIIRARNKR